MQRLVDGPTSVGVDPDLPRWAQRIADGFQAPDILGQWLTSLSDLHLGGLAVGSLAISYACSGPTAGIVQLTQISVLSGGGQPRSAASSAARSHDTNSGPW